MKGQVFVADVIQLDANPAAHADVGRPKVFSGAAWISISWRPGGAGNQTAIRPSL